MELSFQLCSACRDNVASGELFSRTDADSSFDLERFVQRSREAVKGFLA